MAKSLENLGIEGALLYADARQFILLDGLLSSRTFTFSGTTLTTPTAHKLVIGSRIRFTSTISLPTGLSANTDYFVVSVPTATTLTIAATIDQPALSLTSGSGIQTLVEQQLSGEDSISVLVNHELSHANYARSSLNLSVWIVDTINNDARTSQTVTLSPVSPNGSLTYRHILLVRGGSLTLGNTTGDRHELETEAADQVIAQNSNKNIVIRKRKANP